MISNKNLATVILGAAAAFAGYKYINMTEEEKQKLAKSVKDKFNKLKDEAESTAGTAKNYFSDLKNKAGDVLKEHFPEAEKQFNDFFKAGSKAGPSAGTGSATQTEV